MKQPLARLWRGETPLARAFWEFAILYGTFASLVTTIAAMAAIAADLPDAFALTLHLLPVPYNVLMVAAVWRSANRYRGRPLWADLARAAVILWALAASML